MAFIPASSSVVAFQSDATKLVGIVSVSGINFGNSSVIIAPASVTVLQGTNPWQVNVPTPSYISYQAAGSILAVSGTFSSTPQGSITALQAAGSVLAVNMPSPSVIAYQAAGSIMAVSATVNTGNSSVQLLQGVAAIGSVATLQGTNPWIVNVPTPSYLSIQPGGSVLNANISGSVAAVINNSSVWSLQGTAPWVIQSIVGTFGDNTAFTTNDKGHGIVGVRNDTVASIINGDKQYGQFTLDSAGRVLTKPFSPNEASIFAHASVVNGGDSGSVVVLAAAGTGLRNYVTDWTVSNTGSVTTLITFTEGGGSIIGRTIAPAGGGSNMPGMNSPMRNNLANQPINMVTAIASSVVYVTMYGHKAP